MPSPIGHGLAGLAIGLAAEPATVAQTSGWRLSKYAVLGAVFAALPDADLLFAPIHRGVSHSIGATAFLMIIAAVVTGWVTGRVQWRWVLLIGAAHGSHILMDWMGTDRYPPPGLEALWPFSRAVLHFGMGYFSGDGTPRLSSRRVVDQRARTGRRSRAHGAGRGRDASSSKRTRKSRVPTSAPDSLQRPSA